MNLQNKTINVSDLINLKRGSFCVRTNIGIGEFVVKILPITLTFSQLDYIYYRDCIDYVGYLNLVVIITD